jgi:hypothetical protein
MRKPPGESPPAAAPSAPIAALKAAAFRSSDSSQERISTHLPDTEAGFSSAG